MFFECKIHEVLFWTRAPDKSGQHAQTQPPSGFFFLRFLRISSQVPFVGPIKGDALLNNHNLETNSKVTQVTRFQDHRVLQAIPRYPQYQKPWRLGDHHPP